MSQLLSLGQSILAQQPFSQFLGAEITTFEIGRAVLELTIRDEFLQQHGFVHGGVLSYLVDNALTFAGGSVLGEKVVTVEFKVNYIRPARGERLIATATVEGSTKRLAICSCEVVAIENGNATRCAVGQGTITVVG